MAMLSMLRRAADDRGFALVLVLWIAGLLAVLTAGLSGSARTQLRVAANVVEAAKAEALADGGAALAVMDLIAARRARDHQRRFPIDGTPVACAIPGEGTLAISIADEAGRVDVNSAGLPLLRALFAGLGQTPEQAAQLAEAIFDFRDPDDERRPSGAESAQYREAGLSWRPKNGPLQSLAELEQIHGLTPELIERVRPYLSTHSGLPGLDVTIARPELIGLLRAGREGAGAAFAGVPELDETVTLPAMFVSASERVAFALRITARTSAGAVFVRDAVLDLGRRQQGRPIFRSWTRGLTGLSAQDDSTLGRQISSC